MKFLTKIRIQFKISVRMICVDEGSSIGLDRLNAHANFIFKFKVAIININTRKYIPFGGKFNAEFEFNLRISFRQRIQEKIQFEKNVGILRVEHYRNRSKHPFLAFNSQFLISFLYWETTEFSSGYFSWEDQCSFCYRRVFPNLRATIGLGLYFILVLVGTSPLTGPLSHFGWSKYSSNYTGGTPFRNT